MSDTKMHDNEIDINERLVRQLLNEQFPRWAEYSLKKVQSDGTDHAIYRLGNDMCVRLPRLPDDSQIEKEQKWLPQFASLLPLAIPTVLGKGKPNEGYPCHWSIYRWLEGENAINKPITDLHQTAVDLAHFVLALQKMNPTGGPLSSRGKPLHMIDDEVRTAIKSLHDVVDVKAVTVIWEESLQAPKWNKPPVWTHSDLLPANLIIHENKLSAIIDFGMLGIGDPACDLLAAWSILSKGSSRNVFREKLAVDDATWMRGRGWALSIGLIILPYYQHTNPGLVTIGKHLISEVLADA
ncbi:MAG: aminoglycoside phosphotransferase family protein [Gammaproteobacteria bacterium]|jgi:aminoglycoside phosphotransferase (APT) family kinase protein|nr:aminoglycoside phosphotransferase family protein [Gammaproteobacteria bacterium]